MKVTLAHIFMVRHIQTNERGAVITVIIRSNFTYSVLSHFFRIRMRSGFKSGSVFREGTTYVTYEAKDSGGLTDTCYFSVTVSGACYTVLS